ncbi:MAG TPA: hypothetical protein VKT75_05755 [Acidobacteriaceae bacterium]|nr:hypothetical protein [Acidobacteriaceae bacterium]
MALTVKNAQQAAQKYVQNAQAAAPAYASGVQNAGQKWQQNTAAAADTWAAGVVQATTDGRFQNSVNQASATKYQTRSSSVGPQRYQTGVAGAQQSWQTNTQPYLNTLAQLTLQPRQPKGSAANYQRVQQVGQALRAQKLGTNQ